MNSAFSSFKNRLTSAILGIAMVFNTTALPISWVIAEGGSSKSITVGGDTFNITWNETEQVWETDETINSFGTYNFSSYWDPREKTLDYFWDATSSTGKNSRAIKIIFTFDCSDTGIEWKTDQGEASANIPAGKADDRYASEYNSMPDIWFEIPGISSARRGEKQAPLIGQDSKSIVCDGYDLTNDMAVYALKQNVNNLHGGMEVVWNYSPRDIVNEYGLTSGGPLSDSLEQPNTYSYDDEQALHPCAYIKMYDSQHENYDLVKVRMPEMHFGFVSERDNILVDINENEQSKLDGSSLDSNYSWKSICTDVSAFSKTRPIIDDNFYIEISKENVDAFGDDPESVYLNVAGSYIKVKDLPTEIKDGEMYYIAPVDYNRLVDWAKNSGVGNSARMGSFVAYLGVKNDVIRARAEKEYEEKSPDYLEYSELKARENELTETEKNRLAELETKRNEYINQCIVTTMDENGDPIPERLNYTINVNARITRSYADEEGAVVDANIDAEEQGNIAENMSVTIDGNNTLSSSKYPDRHIDSAEFGFRDNPYYGDGGVTISKSDNANLLTASDIMSGETVKYKVGVNSSNIDGNYNITIKDDKLIVLLDDGKTDYYTGDNPTSFSYTYSEEMPNSKYRELQADEYDFVSITIPECKNSISINERREFKYQVVLTEQSVPGGEVTTEILPGDDSYYSTESAKYLESELYGKNVKKVEIRFTDIQGSVRNLAPEFAVKFNLKSDDAHELFRSGQDSLSSGTAPDPYGKLINFAESYACQTINKDTADEQIIYYGKTLENDTIPNDFAGYVDEDTNRFVYKDKSIYPDDPDGEYFGTKTDSKGNTVYVYAARAISDFEIRDPAVDVSTATSYKKYNGEVIDLEKYNIDGISEADIKTSGQYYTELTSTLNLSPTQTTRFAKLEIRTVMPKTLADANGLTANSKLDLSNVKISNINIVEDGTTRTLTANDLINYYDYHNTHTDYVSGTVEGQYYVEIITTIDFQSHGAEIEVEEGTKGSISLTYPLYMNHTVEDLWKSQIGTNEFYGATVAAVVPSSPMTVTGNKQEGIAGTISSYYTPENSTIVHTSSSTENKLPVSATSWNEVALKYVRSILNGTGNGNMGSLDNPGTFGKYAEVNMWEDGTEAQKKMAEYEYKLYFQMGNAYANKVFIYDNVENAYDFNTALNETVVPDNSHW